jgi:hypothetical protein
VWNPAQPEKAEEVEVFVDTGAALERDLAIVNVGSDGYMAPDLVVMAEPGGMEVMGAHSIEGLGLAADPVQKKLVPTIMLALAAMGK